MFSVQTAPVLCCCTDLLCPMWRTWQLPLTFMKSLSAHSSSLMRPFWKMLLLFSVSVFCPLLVSSMNLLRMCSIALLRSLVEGINQTVSVSPQIRRETTNLWLLNGRCKSTESYCPAMCCHQFIQSSLWQFPPITVEMLWENLMKSLPATKVRLAGHVDSCQDSLLCYLKHDACHQSTLLNVCYITLCL